MELELGYGKGKITASIDDKNILGILKPNTVSISETGAGEVRRALDNPIGTGGLGTIVRPGEKVVIITSDITRPIPSSVVLPEVLDELFSAGVKAEDILVVFAVGNHRKHTEEEKIRLVGEEVYNKVRCVDSDSDNCVNLGTTSYGTPVDIFRPVAQADRIICLGNIEYHYFAGYSGGAKAIMPGVSSRAAIQENHSRMVMKEAAAGRIEGNPVRNDIDEIDRFVRIDFILNVILDENKKIIKAVAGHYIKAHRKGCEFLDSLYKVGIPGKADIVLVSAGGYPKDINLYQAQKALDNAKYAVRKDGIVILAASCTEGLGEKVFERWMLGANKPDDLIEDIQHNFEIGGHKAAAIAMMLKDARVFLVSDMQSEFVKRLFMEPFDTVQQALDRAFEILGQDAKVLVMPYGGSTLPYC
jgi:nickel-dependent lactate racemase